MISAFGNRDDKEKTPITEPFEIAVSYHEYEDKPDKPSLSFRYNSYGIPLLYKENETIFLEKEKNKEFAFSIAMQEKDVFGIVWQYKALKKFFEK